MAAQAPTGLLVGEERERHVAGRLLAGPGEVSQVGDDHRVHVHHVDCTPTPDAAVALLAGERVDLPVGGVGGDDVEVAVDRETGTRRVRPLDADHDRGPTRLALDEDGVEADLGELFHDVFGRLALAGAGAVAVVDRLEPDEVGADPGDLILGSGCGLLVVVHRPTLSLARQDGPP